MTETDAIVLLQWIFGALGAVALGMFGIWWKIESRQDRKIDTLAKSNHEAHEQIYRRIEATREQMNEQHTMLHDKLMDIWKYMKGVKDD